MRQMAQESVSQMVLSRQADEQWKGKLRPVPANNFEGRIRLYGRNNFFFFLFPKRHSTPINTGEH
jgi:hypothetical protein